MIQSFSFTSLRFFFCWGLLIVPAFAAKLKTPLTGVTVEKTPVELLRRTFNRKDPLADMPPLAPLEAGLCDNRFSCETKLEVSMPTAKRGTVQATVTSMTVTTGLKIVVWTEENTTDKVIAHEETHRQIAEHYYDQAESIARRLAEKTIGRKIPVEIRNGTPDLKTALSNMQNQVVAGYLDETGRRCIYAQERFDAITDHSRNPVAEEEAMALALKEEEIHRANEK